ncbi:condensation domain-containing protein, partial [Streptomyces sp. SID10815]|uniref:condensation domain-containing protein n=1 Tax=Streptomyces sp. SID10815 TaxID=2706027 RepID=UPI0013CAE663
LRFSRDGLGQHTVGDDAGDGLVLHHRDLSPLGPAAQDRAMAAEIARAQRGLRPERRPLGRAVLFSLGPHRPDRLFVTVHHLVIDAVSWQVLLAELDRAHGQAASGTPVDLGPPPASFQDWAHRLAQYTADGEFDPEAAYWSRTAGRVHADLPRDLDGVAAPGDERAVTVRLGAAWTEALLRDVPQAYRTQVNDVLLAALAHVLAHWSGRGQVAIALEGHGREARALGGGLDLSGALGWFTTLFPVVLEVPGTPGWGALLKSVKEQLRAVPRRGVGYGALRHLRPGTSGGQPLPDHAEPPVSFNYLGRLTTSDASGTLFARPPGRFELFGGDRGVRTRPLDVTALVADGQLEFTWHHSAARHREETVRRLAEEVLEALRAIVRHCAGPNSGGATPSDFPLAGLEQAEVDRLVGDGRTVRDLLPLTPVQSGMLFHHLSAPDAGVYLEQVHLDVRGVPDPDALARAWQETVERTPELRAAVVWADAGRPLLAVHRHCVLPLAHHDWRALSPARQRERLRDLLAADRAAPPALDRPPLMRLALVRLSGDRVRVVWTFHHVLLDGWSVFHVLSDVMAAHAALARGEAPRLPERR